MRDTAMTPDLKPEPFAWHYKNRTGWQQGYSARPPVDAIAAPDSGWTVNPLYTQDQLDAAVRAEREACAHIARLRGSEANRLFKDHVQPVKNMIQRDEAFAIAAAIRARGE